MANERQIKQFIEEIAPCAQKAYKEVGKIYPSICIGMACVECAYGMAGSVKHHSYLGQKVGTGKTATKYWSGKFFTSKTKEEYTVGTHTTIRAAFRAYDDMQQCVLNYYELLNTKLYSRVMAGVSQAEQMKQIKQCGYMTSSTEVNSVLTIIDRYNLKQYDTDISSAGNPYPEPSQNMKLNSQGDGVKWLQWELLKAGYIIQIDGIAGNLTIGALMDYQKKHDLVPDGICGRLTKKSLTA